MAEKMKWYVAGGMYGSHDAQKFALVRPSGNSLPYVWPERDGLGCDGSCLGRLSAHHAGLYLVSEDGRVLTLVGGGAENVPTPKKITMDETQVASVRAGKAKVMANVHRRMMRFLTDCVSCSGKRVELLCGAIDAEQEITRRTFVAHVNRAELQDIERSLGYDSFRMVDDYHVTYHKSKWGGQDCYYFVHSAIEYVFTAENDNAA